MARRRYGPISERTVRIGRLGLMTPRRLGDAKPTGPDRFGVAGKCEFARNVQAAKSILLTVTNSGKKE